MTTDYRCPRAKLANLLDNEGNVRLSNCQIVQAPHHLLIKLGSNNRSPLSRRYFVFTSREVSIEEVS